MKIHRSTPLPDESILGLVDAEEEPFVRAAAEILQRDLSVVRTRKEFESQAPAMGVLVIGNDQSPADRVSTVRHARMREESKVIAAIADELPMKLDLLEAGASFVVSLEDPPERLASGIEAAGNGECLLRPVEVAAVVHRLQHLAKLCVDQGVDIDRCELLTAREREIVTRLARRRSNVEIADELGIAVGTVKTHVHHILEKLDVENRGLAGIYWRVFDEKRGLRR